MYCTVCGKEIAQGARFCSNCGAAAAAGPGFAGTGTGFAGGVPVRPLVRPRANRVLGGVCAAFALTYGWDLTLVRVLTAVGGILLPPFVVIGYLAAWVFMPEEPWAVPSSPPPAPPPSPTPPANA